MLDRINTLLGWDEDTQELLRNLSRVDLNSLNAIRDADWDSETTGDDDGENPQIPELYREHPEVTHMTSKGRADALLFARLQQIGWMVQKPDSFIPAEVPADIRENFLTYEWTPKGLRLLPQFLSYYYVSGKGIEHHYS